MIAGGDAGPARAQELLDQTVGILLPGGQPAWSETLLAIGLVDLLGRLFPKISIVCDPKATVEHPELGGTGGLRERLEALRHNAIQPKEPGRPTIVVGIGQASGEADLFVGGSGWQTYIGPSPGSLSDASERSPVGPLIAACRGAARVFGQILGVAGLSPNVEPWYWSALTYRWSQTQSNEPAVSLPRSIETALVGLGSVGGAALYLLRFVPDLEGELDLVDPQNLESHNPIRALLATAEDAIRARPKVEAGSEALAPLRGIQVRGQAMSMRDFVASRPREATLPLVLSAVDSVSARREIQDCLPLDVINAACSPREVAISGHRTDTGPCVYCLHLPQVMDRDAIQLRLLTRASGLPEAQVLQQLVKKAPLSAGQIRSVESHRRVPSGSLERFVGRLLPELYEAELRYAEAKISSEDGATVAVATPFVTALAGFVLAAEALKASGAGWLAPYRLGPSGPGIKYGESLYHPGAGMLTTPRRWHGTECLCRSSRRLRLLRERYGLS